MSSHRTPKQELVPEPRVEANGPALIVAMPTRGGVSIEAMICLATRMDKLPHNTAFEIRKGIVEDRNSLVSQIQSAVRSSRFVPTEWFILWVDDDAL